MFLGNVDDHPMSKRRQGLTENTTFMIPKAKLEGTVLLALPEKEHDMYDLLLQNLRENSSSSPRNMFRKIPFTQKL